MAALTFLSNIAIVLFTGLLMGILAKKLRIPSMLLLILAGAGLKNLSFNGIQVITFTNDFLISTSIFAFVIIIFEGSSNFSFSDLDSYGESALKIVIMFLILNMLFLSLSTFYIFNINNIILSLIFAAVMSGTDPSSVLSLFNTKSNKITEILKFESVFNTPIVVLIPFILLDLLELDANIITNFVEYFYPFLQQIITGVGTGVFFGMIVFRFMKKFYSDKLSPLTLITSSLLTYILAENLGGNGVIAVTVFGILFGNVRVKKKIELKGFSSMLSRVLEILVFTLLGFLLPTNLELGFLLKSLILFFIMIFIRWIVIELTYMHDHVNLKERVFMSLNCPKGIAVAVVAFLLSNYLINNTPFISYPGAKLILDLMILFILYSIILSSIMARFSQHFIRLKVEN